MARCTRPLPLLTGLLGACGGLSRRTPPPPVLPFVADSLRSETIRPGVIHRFIYTGAGPWAIQVLEVDLDQCYSAVAVKGAEGAIGRAKTSTLLRDLRRTETVLGGVNADFFLFTPPGVPTGALISRGRLLAGPSNQPVLAFDSSGAPHITSLQTSGDATTPAGSGGRRFELRGWNRAVPDGVALFDAGWGREMDTASAAIEVVLSGVGPARVIALDTSTAGVVIPAAGRVLFAGRNAPASLRAGLLSLRAGDSVRVEVSLAPFHPPEAVGGRPVLVRDSTVATEVDTEGQPGFATGRHPRTAAGIARGGKRLILAVVDGRQRPYSDGMTLRELANLLLALGARDALNLDGGGSTTLVYADPDSGGRLRIANRPSDPAGERPVGDALAIVRGCRGRSRWIPYR